MAYEIRVSRPVEREVRALPQQVRDRLRSAVRELAENPRPAGCEKLAGTNDRYRIRVGDYRVVYEINDDEQQILVETVRHRRDVYRHR